MPKLQFEWNDAKDRENLGKHHVSFDDAQEAFFDPNRLIARDNVHSTDETRYYCMGKVAGRVMTVRFTLRSRIIRIIGAGYWRKGKKQYEKERKLHG